MSVNPQPEPAMSHVAQDTFTPCKPVHHHRRLLQQQSGPSVHLSPSLLLSAKPAAPRCSCPCREPSRAGSGGGQKIAVLSSLLHPSSSSPRSCRR
eukprot:764255-Hanusia_phi.AAC.2